MLFINDFYNYEDFYRTENKVNTGELVMEIIYEKKLVAFLDILGFKEYLESNKDKPEKTYDALNKLKRSMCEGRESEDFKEFSISYFSDCILVSVPFPQDDAMLLYHFIEHISKVSALLFEGSGILLRGGIAIGDLFHRKSEEPVFGPALNDAYWLESKIAIYPRIILHDKCFLLVNEYCSVNGKPNFSKILSRYSDGCVGTDIVKYIKRSAPDSLGLEGKARRVLRKKFNDAIGEPDVFVKIDWLKTEYEKAGYPELISSINEKLFPDTEEN